jgi:hypothetical protein
MKKIFSLFITIFSLLLHQPAVAQSKQKAEKEFLKQLNTVLQHSKQQHWAYEGNAMTVDSAFAINKEGLLSVTVHYTSDSSFIRTRMTAPVSKIDKVLYDLYIILDCKDKPVTFYQSEPGSNELKEVNKGGRFHIGAPEPEDVRYREKLEKALVDLRKYYRK